MGSQKVGHDLVTKQQYLSQKMFFLPQRTLIFIFLKDLLTVEIVSLSRRIQRRRTHTHTHTHTHKQYIITLERKIMREMKRKNAQSFLDFKSNDFFTGLSICHKGYLAHLGRQTSQAKLDLKGIECSCYLAVLKQAQWEYIWWTYL